MPRCSLNQMCHAEVQEEGAGKCDCHICHAGQEQFVEHSMIENCTFLVEKGYTIHRSAL